MKKQTNQAPKIDPVDLINSLDDLQIEILHQHLENIIELKKLNKDKKTKEDFSKLHFNKSKEIVKALINKTLKKQNSLDIADHSFYYKIINYKKILSSYDNLPILEILVYKLTISENKIKLSEKIMAFHELQEELNLKYIKKPIDFILDETLQAFIVPENDLIELKLNVEKDINVIF